MQLKSNGCRGRQQRLRAALDEINAGSAILSNPKHVLYLTGFRTGRNHRSAVVLRKNGFCVLISADPSGDLAFDEHVSYKPSALSTLRPDQASQIAELAAKVLDSTDAVGVDKSDTNAFLAGLAERPMDLDPLLFHLRRRKDEDEMALLKKAIESTEAAYARAREIIQPGISELEVYAELYKAAVLEAGEDLWVFGNDFQCASRGGPPRSRRAEAGELYILDLGPEYAGYFADNCRTFAVDRNPSEVQLQAWEQIVPIFGLIEERVRPGVSCRQIYLDVKERLDAYHPNAFSHHLGHGIGLSPHEEPYLNPKWDHQFAAGDVFTVEPGLYFAELKGGIRLEENFLVTEQGVQRLTSFPLEL